VEKETNKSYKIISYISAIAFCTLAYWILGKYFNFYYDLNDDVLIKDILSGIYTGNPEGHNMQMLYPISWLLKCLYSINSSVVWFGWMEIGLMWLCSVLLLSRTQYIIIGHINARKWKIVTSFGLYISVVIFALGTQLWEVIIVQYTVVSAMLATTAAYLVFTDEAFEINENIVPIILVILSFNIRSEMLLLMSPFIATVGFCKWLADGFDWQTCKKYLSYLAIILCGLGLSLLVNYIAYSNNGWKEFESVFNSRTTLYDFTGIPDYEDHEDFYEGQLVDEYDYNRLIDYNYVLSDRVNAQFLNALAEYAKEHNTRKLSIPYAFFEVIHDMVAWKTPSARAKLTDNDSAFYEEGIKLHVPFNTVIIILYILAVIAAIYTRNIKWAYTLPILLIMRNISWGYVYMNGRINARIAHPLYFAECVILVGVVLVAWSESDYSSIKERRHTSTLLITAFAACIVINGLYIVQNVNDIKNKSDLREQYNSEVKALYAYTSSDPREYYLIDVYSTVNYTERIFEKEIYGKGNTQLAGGWMALSPLDDYKQSFYQEEYKFVTSNEIDAVNAIDEITGDDGKPLFYVYNVSDIKER